MTRKLDKNDDQWTSSVRNFVAISDDRIAMVPGRTCACGQEFTDTHAENCKLGGGFVKRHNAFCYILLEEGIETGHVVNSELPIPVNQRGDVSNGRMDCVFRPISLQPDF